MAKRTMRNKFGLLTTFGTIHFLWLFGSRHHSRTSSSGEFFDGLIRTDVIGVTNTAIRTLVVFLYRLMAVLMSIFSAAGPESFLVEIFSFYIALAQLACFSGVVATLFCICIVVLRLGRHWVGSPISHFIVTCLLNT